LEFALQKLQQLLCPGFHVVFFQQALFLRCLRADVGGDEVDEKRMLLNIAQHDARLVRHIGRMLDDLF
jgi:hypothetical protein